MPTARIEQLVHRMQDEGIDLAVITDDDSVFYFTGYFDYLHMEFGRPTILLVWSSGRTLLITPSLDYNTARDSARVDRIEAWNDGVGEEWREHLSPAITASPSVALETGLIPQLVKSYIEQFRSDSLADISPLVAEMRMVKSEEELQMARHAGEVATAMMQAGREAIGDGVPEYEVALATTRAGTLKAAELLREHYPDSAMSPNMHYLQIMASGPQITRTHHRASNRIMRRGEPVFLCFCGMTNFHRFKLGFDRIFWIGHIADKTQEAIYQVAVESQAAALQLLRPGTLAEEVHGAYAEVIQSAGYDYPFRCGRGTGFSYLEQPQLVFGDKTELKPGMVFAVDGSVCTTDFRAQVGDSFIVTEGGYEQITHHSKRVDDMILP